MDAEHADASVARIAAAIAEPARARMLCCLLDGHARTATELAVVAEVSPSTASAHLARLKEQRLIGMTAQGKHRYYTLDNPSVAAALEALMVAAGSVEDRFVPRTPSRLRAARTCYDHMAGAIAVAMHDRWMADGWLVPEAGTAYRLTEDGAQALLAMGLDLDALRTRRRRFACACLDWSERRPHLGGALGAALLQHALERGWMERELDSRALRLTRLGQRELRTRFGLEPSAAA